MEGLEVEHTKGPWKASCPETDSYGQYYVYVDTYQNGFDKPILAELVDDFCTDEESQSNARLISAAPCLLEALKEALDVMGNWGEDGVPAWAERAREAISKAEGKQ